ncbi:MAG: hypothetical protein AAB404_00540 [Patescibacteria group bacterium]
MNSNPVFAKWTHRFFWLAVIVLIIVLIGSGFFIFQYLQSRGLTMEIIGPAEINIGVPFNLTVDFSNQSQNILRNAKLSVSLPDGAVILGAAENQKVYTEDLGDIGIGSLTQKPLRLVITKDENTLKRFTAYISYGASGIGQARFEERREFDLRIKEPGVSLDLTLPDQVLSGEKFDIKINYRDIAQENFSGLELQVDYPASFAFESASPKPAEASNTWELKNLSPNAEGDIVISGRLIGQGKSVFNFDAKLTINVLGRRYSMNQKSGSLAIAASPLEISVFLNEQENSVVQLGDQLIYVISYQNNSGVGLADAVIKVKLTGELFDFNTLQTNANFNSVTNTLTWNASNMPELRVLSAGDTGLATFQIRAKDQFSIRRLGDKNYYLKAEAKIDSPTVPYYLSAEKTTGMATLETKMAGAIKIETKAYFRDAASGVINRGPWPPRVNQPTQYTVHWLITNYATDVRNVEVRAFLESGVDWTGQVKSNTGSLPVYNERTQEIVWLINEIPATKGVIGQSLEAIFQINATPNVIQAGNYQPLIKETSIIAFDKFSETRLQNQVAGINSFLPDDLTVSQIKGIVEQ